MFRGHLAAIVIFSIDESDGAPDYNKTVTTTGLNFPDTLAGRAFAGHIGIILLLVDDSINGRTGMGAIISHYAERIGTGYFLGGTNALPQALRDAVIAASR